MNSICFGFFIKTKSVFFALNTYLASVELKTFSRWASIDWHRMGTRARMQMDLISKRLLTWVSKVQRTRASQRLQPKSKRHWMARWEQSGVSSSISPITISGFPLSYLFTINKFLWKLTSVDGYYLAQGPCLTLPSYGTDCSASVSEIAARLNSCDSNEAFWHFHFSWKCVSGHAQGLLLSRALKHKPITLPVKLLIWFSITAVPTVFILM